MFDTGFSYWLAIDKQDLDAFGWTYVHQQTMKTARGNFKFDIYAGKIKLDGQEYDIPVHVGKGLSEVLLGRQWLTTRRLLVDMRCPWQPLRGIAFANIRMIWVYKVNIKSNCYAFGDYS